MPSIVESSFCMNFLLVRAICTYVNSRNELSNLTFIFFECVLCVVFFKVLNIFSCVMILFY